MSDYDIWINLLNHGSYEEIGRAVIQALIQKKAEAGKGSYRQIIVGGS